jgi:hypothetical protein
MAYLTATGTNQRLLGAIQIDSVKAVGAPIDAASVEVSRRDMAGSTVILIATIDINVVDDLTFSFLDKNVLSGHTYRYSLVPLVGEVEQTTVNVTVLCSFDAIFVSDTSGDYMASLNVKYQAKKNIQTGYVQPLSSKYPHAVRNSSANYFSGSAEGVFVPYSVACVPVLSTMEAYKDAALEMLANGLTKTLRTYDGHGWLVSIDGDLSRNTDQFIGGDSISFNWTEVGIFPTTGVVIL